MQVWMSGGAPDDAVVKAEECGGGDADGREALGARMGARDMGGEVDLARLVVMSSLVRSMGRWARWSVKRKLGRRVQLRVDPAMYVNSE